jgi:signal transduction histidine kinase/CheY-like chemotaxis protein
MRNDSWPEQRLYRLIFQHSLQPTVVIDDDGRVLVMNQAAHALERDVGIDLRRFFLWSAESHPDLVSFRARLRVGGRASAELEVAAPDTSRRRLALEGRSHGPRHAVAIADVTERMELERELRHLRRLEAVGATTGGVVHDFNNLLTAVLCASAALARLVRDDDRAAAMAGEIQSAAERAANLVRRILRLLRREHALPERVQLSEVLAEMRPLLELVAGESVELAFDLGPELPDTLVEREQLEQVVINLVANARDAMPHGGRVTISTSNVQTSADGSGAYVALKVADTGEGMTPEVLERVFERFFTTKGADRGTGLGLASAHRFVKASGGCISVKSAPRRGTTVIVYLPHAASDIPPASSGERGDEAPGARGVETIVVIEPDDSVRGTVRRVLSECGYHVLDAPTGETALRQANGAMTPVDLVLSDVAVSGLGAAGVVDRLRRMGQSPKLLWMSGVPDRSPLAAGRRDGVVERVLHKAFGSRELLATVREVLDGAREPATAAG